EFNVTQDGKLCLYADLKLGFSVDYEDLDDEVGVFKFFIFFCPSHVNESTCGETQSVLKLNFGAGNSWSITFSKTGESYQADTINFTYNLGDPVYFPNTKSEGKFYLVTVTTMPTITNVGVDTSYSCKSAEELKGGAVSMTLSDVLIQAFISDGVMSDSSKYMCCDTAHPGYSSVITETTVPTTDTKKFRLHALNVSLTSGSPVGSTNLSLWEASVGSSYMCNKEQTFNISDSLTIYTFSLHVQPFGVQKGVFSTAQECSLDDTSILVPIIVGAALAGLILIVVIAYVIGRRKTYVGYQTL
uniref:Lysosomal-associated membrane protein 2 n=1 Tax=Amphilophus citrinellus TaxID=61819 RepID=A0A3Q0S9R3_AMPCI